MSENSKIHSLKPNFSSWPRSCRRIATPMHNGKDELPSSSMSHRWNILCSGNTSVNETIHYMLSHSIVCHRAVRLGAVHFHAGHHTKWSNRYLVYKVVFLIKIKNLWQKIAIFIYNISFQKYRTTMKMRLHETLNKYLSSVTTKLKTKVAIRQTRSVR